MKKKGKKYQHGGAIRGSRPGMTGLARAGEVANPRAALGGGGGGGDVRANIASRSALRAPMVAKRAARQADLGHTQAADALTARSGRLAGRADRLSQPAPLSPIGRTQGFKSGGYVGDGPNMKRDGIAQRGKTRGRII